MKNILHIIDTTGPGGAETIFIDLISHIPADKYRSIVLIRGKGWVHDELLRRGITPLVVDAKGSFNWRYLLKLRQIIKQYNIDLIQSHLLGSNIYASMAGIITLTPVVSVFHGAVDISHKERFQWLKMALLNIGSKKIVAVSNRLKQALEKTTSLSRKKLCVIYNGIDVNKYDIGKTDDLRKKYQWGEEITIIGLLGNIRPAKGYDVLIRAAAIVKSEAPDLRFVIAGQSKQGLQEELEHLRESLDVVDRVVFDGFNQYPEQFLSAIDMFLLSSTSEGFSIATIQAMAAGLPVVATKSGGPEEILTDGIDGILVESGSPQALAEGILRVCRDQSLQNSISKEGKASSRSRYDISVMIEQYCRLYEQ